MEEKERYKLESYHEAFCEIHDTKSDEWYLRKDLVTDLLNQQSNRIKELEEENQQLKDQVKKSYQEGLLQKQFDKDMEIQELKDKIEQLKQSQKQLAVEELERVQVQCQFDITFADYEQEQRLYDYINSRIKSLKGEK